MAYVVADPAWMTTAASDLATIESDVSAARLVAAARTTSVVPAAADEISAAIANLMSTHALDFQAMMQNASTFHEQFTHNINAAAASYSSTESASAAAITPRVISLSEFFEYSLSGLATSTGNFIDSFGSFPNLAWDQLGTAANNALAILLWPIVYPATAITVYVVEAALAAILGGG
ncbi:PE family protein [Mycobacterium intermedium]|uniref:PE family protein n=1 Tax=Mycobacterium intermedium TaxID=28445 RepID=A0A1E3S577_MYCIE|nr:PE family protein [Mycobacterium intermedium]MCV6964138.1 PE family protein [Mycobacterium intermedium]ODQ97325.1 hypothetical protein BHQ20_26860 [Mycobacterium intermedium]OPE45521.1 PE family protein [Mycobacterium intermedium]ORA94336.1 PE family protein [Mycobacterium intermedium]